VITLSIVIPAYNEQEVISHSLREIANVLSGTAEIYEIIVVNDGSTDKTADEVINLARDIPQIRLINSNRNYGHSEALAIGMKQSRGKLVLTMDSDMQHPPKLIQKMLQTIRNKPEIDVVQGLRESRDSDPFLKKFAAKSFYSLMSSLTNLQIIPNASDFRLMNSKTVKLINELPERKKTLRFLIPYLGLKISVVKFKDEKRFAGKSKYSWKKMISFGLSSVISFSAKPLYLVAIVGLFAAVSLVVMAVVTLFVWLYAKTIPGWTSLVLFILSSNAVILSSLGILGLYIGRIYETSLGRPSSLWTEHKN
jgi:dolichol-phosphate mannosyltransferase